MYTHTQIHVHLFTHTHKHVHVCCICDNHIIIFLTSKPSVLSLLSLELVELTKDRSCDILSGVKDEFELTGELDNCVFKWDWNFIIITTSITGNYTCVYKYSPLATCTWSMLGSALHNTTLDNPACMCIIYIVHV